MRRHVLIDTNKRFSDREVNSFDCVFAFGRDHYMKIFLWFVCLDAIRTIKFVNRGGVSVRAMWRTYEQLNLKTGGVCSINVEACFDRYK